jgi:hypothetical protein
VKLDRTEFIKGGIFSLFSLFCLFSLYAPEASATAVTVGINVNGSGGTTYLPLGSSFTLKWKSANAKTCAASTYRLNGGASVAWGVVPNTAVTFIGTLTINSLSYTIKCTGWDGSVAAKTVTIRTPPPLSISLTLNEQTGPLSLAQGAPFTLSWSSKNATTCSTASSYNINGVSSPWPVGANSTVVYTGTFSGRSLSYTLTCTGLDGSSASKTVSMAALPLSITITLNGQTGDLTLTQSAAFTLEWSSRNAANCAAASEFRVNGAAYPWPVGANTTVAFNGTFSGNSLSYTLTCTGYDGTVASRTVSMTEYTKYLSTSLVYMNSASTPINVTLSNLRLNSDYSVSGTAYFVDARNDLSPFYSVKTANPMFIGGAQYWTCLSVNGAPPLGIQNIPMPGVFRNSQTVNGAWGRYGNSIIIYTNSTIGLNFTVTLDAADGPDSYVVTNVVGYNTWRGYAFLSDQNPMAYTSANGPMTDSQILSFYSGKIEENLPARDEMAFTTRSWAMNWHGMSDPSPDVNIRSATNMPNDGHSIYGFSDLVRNMPGGYSNMIFASYGHDYNNDDCANDGGHEMVYFGIPDQAGRYAKFLVLESSYTGNLTPALISVGRLKGQ